MRIKSGFLLFLLWTAAFTFSNFAHAGSLARANMCGDDWYFSNVNRTYVNNANNPNSIDFESCSGVGSAASVSMTIAGPYTNNPFYIVSPSGSLYRSYTYSSGNVNNIRIALVGKPEFSAGSRIHRVDFFIQGNGSGPSGSDSVRLHGTLSNITLTPPNLGGSTGASFGNTFVGQSAGSRVAVLRNNSSGSLQITDVFLTGGNSSRFGISSGSGNGSVAGGGGTRSIGLTYSTSSIGSHSTGLKIRYTYQGVPYSITLPVNGSTVSAPTNVSNSTGIDFGTVVRGQADAASAFFRNSGAGALSITNVALVGSDAARFRLVSGTSSGTIGSGGSRTIRVEYRADLVGTHSASVRVTFSNNGNTETTNLSLSGRTQITIAPAVSLLLLDDGEPVTPPPDLGGPDQNGDGVRDDVAAFIDTLSEAQTAAGQTALYDFARDVRYLITNTDNPNDVSGSHVLRSIGCSYQLFGLDTGTLQLLDTITARHTDTEARLVSYIGALNDVVGDDPIDFDNDDLCTAVPAQLNRTSTLGSLEDGQDQVAQRPGVNFTYEDTCVGGVDDFQVFYLNGMFNSLAAAEQSRARLSQVLNVPVILNYQENENALLQVLEVFKQAQLGVIDEFLTQVYNEDTADQVVRDEMLAQRIGVGDLVSDNDLDQQIAKYRQYIDAGKNAILIAHSQGNFYANNAYNDLFANPATRQYTDHMYIHGFASPATSVAGGGDYISLGTDQIINGVRLAIPATLPVATGPNPPYENTTGDATSFGHNFVTAYMFHPDIRDILTARINNIVATLATPTNVSFQIRLEVISSFPTTMYVEEASGNILRNGATVGTQGTITGSGRTFAYQIPCATAATNSILRSGVDLPALVPNQAGMQLKVFNGVRQIDMRNCLIEDTEVIGQSLALFPVGYLMGDGTIGDFPNPFVVCQ